MEDEKRRKWNRLQEYAFIVLYERMMPVVTAEALPGDQYISAGPGLFLACS